MKKITHEQFCTGQVKRFSCLPFAPTESEGVKEIITTLTRCTSTDEQAKAVVDELIPTLSQWPTPGEIRQTALALKPEPTYNLGPKPTIECPDCQDFGNIKQGDQYVRCHCAASEMVPQEYLDLLNKPKQATLPPNPRFKQPPKTFTPITGSDIERAIHEQREERERREQAERVERERARQQDTTGEPPEAA